MDIRFADATAGAVTRDAPSAKRYFRCPHFVVSVTTNLSLSELANLKFVSCDAQRLICWLFRWLYGASPTDDSVRETVASCGRRTPQTSCTHVWGTEQGVVVGESVPHRGKLSHGVSGHTAFSGRYLRMVESVTY